MTLKPVAFFGIIGGVVGGAGGAIPVAVISTFAFAVIKSANADASARPLVLFTVGTAVVCGTLGILGGAAFGCLGAVVKAGAGRAWEGIKKAVKEVRQYQDSHEESLLI